MSWEILKRIKVTNWVECFSKQTSNIEILWSFHRQLRNINRDFWNRKIDITIDDAYHLDESVIITFNESPPYLNQSILNFIDENRTAYKKFEIKYSQYNFD